MSRANLHACERLWRRDAKMMMNESDENDNAGDGDDGEEEEEDEGGG